MKLTVTPNTQAAPKDEFCVIDLVQPSGARLGQLDIQYSELAALGDAQPRVLDFLLLAAAVYGFDKLVNRDTAIDGWTRRCALRIPVSDPRLWDCVREQLVECLSFLTGDQWSFEFLPLEASLAKIAQKPRRQIVAQSKAEAVSLFSGGLDSLVGIIDWLEQHPSQRLMLVGHHDSQMPGPFTDQKTLLSKLQASYPGRISSVLVRIGHHEPAKEITLRSRSLVFIALGIFGAASIGNDVSLIIPENGTIAINVPLTPSRRGSCSTRTTHPFFLKTLSNILVGLGIRNPLSNPLALKTKGEAVSECKNMKLLSQLAEHSVSCAKRGHTSTWLNRAASGCGRCMPCIYRRAALNTIKIDDEQYGRDICIGDVDVSPSNEEGPNDLRACISFLNRKPSSKEIAKMLLTNGSLDVTKLNLYVDLVQRAMQEIRQLFQEKATPKTRKQLGLT